MKIGLIIVDGATNSAEVCSLALMLRDAGVSVVSIESLTRVQTTATVAEIIAAAAEETEFSVAQLTGESRGNPVSTARFAIAWVAAQATGASTTIIGKAMGKRDHSTIVHQLRRARELRQTNGEFRGLTNRLLRRFTRTVQ